MRNLFSLPNEDTIHPLVVKNFKRNFFANLFDSGFWFFGDSFVAAYTILPVFISTMTDSPLVIGLIPAFEAAGWFLPQLFLARHLEGMKRRLPLVLKLGVLERFPLLLMAITALMIPIFNKGVAVFIFLVIYVLKTLASGLVALPWQELIATVIPVSHRGRFWGYALILGKLMGIFGSLITGFLLTSVTYPKNYAMMFGLGFFGVSISFIFTTLNIEPVIERAVPKDSRELSLWNRMGSILKSDRNFLNFLINRAVLFLGTMGLGFITVYGIQKYQLPLYHSAIFTFVMLVAEIIGYGIWGTHGDKAGYKIVLEFCNLLFIFGLLILLVFNSIWGLYLAFGIISIAHAGEYIADQNIAMEFSSEAERPIYIGMSKTLTGPFLLVAPIIGGALVKLWNYQGMFLISLVISILAYGTIRFLVVEPRFSN